MRAVIEWDATDLWPAIEALTKPTRSAPWPGHTDQTVPAVWVQLLHAVGRGGGEGTSIARSRPPVATNVLSILDDVQRLLAQELRANGTHPIRIGATQERDIPAELRRIHSLLLPYPAASAAWAMRVDDWRRQALALLEPDTRLVHLRIPCPGCGEHQVATVTGGETYRSPALEIIWEDTQVRFIYCRACAQVWQPEQFHSILTAPATA